MTARPMTMQRMNVGPMRLWIFCAAGPAGSRLVWGALSRLAQPAITSITAPMAGASFRKRVRAPLVMGSPWERMSTPGPDDDCRGDGVAGRIIVVCTHECGHDGARDEGDRGNGDDTGDHGS